MSRAKTEVKKENSRKNLKNKNSGKIQLLLPYLRIYLFYINAF